MSFIKTASVITAIVVLGIAGRASALTNEAGYGQTSQGDCELVGGTWDSSNGNGSCTIP